MALLLLASRAAKLKQAPRFSVLSVDHGLRPEAGDEVKQVAAWCKALGLAHISLKTPEPLHATRVQEAARQQRYQAMAAWCQKHKAAALLVAHHREDQAETVVMRLLHGSGVNGLAGMSRLQRLHTKAGAVEVMRPLLDVPRAALRAMLEKAGQAWIEDPSNEDTKYERVRLRQQMPHLQAHGLATEQLVAVANHMRQARAVFDAQAVAWLQAQAGWSDYGYIEICRQPFLALGEAMQKRILAALISYLGGQIYAPKRQRLARLCARVADAPSGAATLAGCLMRWRRDTLMLGREAAGLGEQKLSQPTRQLWDQRFDVALSRPQAQQGVYIDALGRDGLAQLKADKWPLPKHVPAAYLHVLPAFFNADGVLACATLAPRKGFRAARDENKTAFAAIFAPDNTGKA